MIRLTLLAAFWFTWLASSPRGFAQSSPSEAIRLNQVGFFPLAPKKAAVVGNSAAYFAVINTSSRDTVFKGTLGPEKYWLHSEEKVRLADFSKLTKPGTYILFIPRLGYSHPFTIQNNIYAPVVKAGLKAFYYLRASTDLPEKYAGPWHRKAGHPDNQVKVHATAASAQRPAGTKIAAPGGWYDAGDYGKYVVNAAFATWHLVALQENYPAFSNSIKTNIPESNNALPDLLDEALWNIRWMMAMQDLHDGGVYHKLTTASHAPIVVPAADTAARYVIYKSTAAAYDLAAILAQAARVYKPYKKQLPGFTDSCLTAARRAWQWANQNPDKAYNQKKLNEQYSPKIQTGEYGDSRFKDEAFWAAAELWTTTGEQTFAQALALQEFTREPLKLQSWQFVYPLGLLTLLRAPKTSFLEQYRAQMQQQVLTFADSLQAYASRSAYGTPMGITVQNFSWGSNGLAANQANILLEAYWLTGQKRYVEAAQSNLDYLLGRNATGYGFITGFGSHSAKYPHYRPTMAAGQAGTVPGFLVGGPNPGQNDKDYCKDIPYPSRLPAKSYLDHICSFASNEIAINWNGPLVYFLGALEAINSEKVKK